MEIEAETTPSRRLGQRSSARVKTRVNYKELNMSYDDQPTPRKKAKSDDSSYDEDSESKTDDDTSEIENNIQDEEEEEISEYEKLRLKNLEENRRIMIELGIIDIKTELKPKPKPKKRQKPKKPPGSIEPLKRSLRLLNKTPDGKDLAQFIFQESPAESPGKEAAKARIEEETLPMSEDGESTDLLDSLRATLSQDSTSSSDVSTLQVIDNLRDLKFVGYDKVTMARVQGLCVHPMESKLLVIAGSKEGQLGIWNATDNMIAMFNPHLRPINHVSVSHSDHSKLFTVSFDGTLRRADINKSVFDMVYQTDKKRNMCHLTWFSQMDENNLIVAHGTGEAGIVDTRAKSGQRWFHCHPRSIRTTHIHPNQPHYFITASGTGESKIWDIRGSKKHVDEWVGDLSLKSGRGLTSAFFSPDGNKVVSTCNDDFIRIYDTSDLANPKELNRTVHDNHTGRWLSVFKAVWYPHSSDLFFVGSMLTPRRLQMYNSSGRLLREVQGEEFTTIIPVITSHPTLPVVVGGNASGKVHVFTTKDFKNLVNLEED